MFSVLQVRKFFCPHNHYSGVMKTSLGIQLKTPKAGEKLVDIFAAYFAKKISILECTSCKRVVNTDYGSERIYIVKFPKYLVVFLDEFDKNSCLESPLIGIEHTLDVTKFVEPDVLTTYNHKIEYVLQSIVAHPQTTNKKNSSYTAIVKKKV